MPPVVGGLAQRKESVMDKNELATIEALKVTRPDDRLWLLKKASSCISPVNLGTFCAKVGATEEELGKLLLDKFQQEVG